MTRSWHPAFTDFPLNFSSQKNTLRISTRPLAFESFFSWVHTCRKVLKSPCQVDPSLKALLKKGNFGREYRAGSFKQSMGAVPWHSLYKHSLYVTKFIRTFFIRDKVYTGQSLYRTKFIQGQSLYGDKVYTGTKFIRDKVHTVTKFIRGQSLYKLFACCVLKRLILKC